MSISSEYLSFTVRIQMNIHWVMKYPQLSLEQTFSHNSAGLGATCKVLISSECELRWNLWALKRTDPNSRSFLGNAPIPPHPIHREEISKSELHPAERKKKGNIWDQRKRKGFGAREGGHFPSAQQKILTEIAEIKNVRDLWGKPGPET